MTIHITKAWLLDTLERVGLTAAEAIAASLILAGAGLFSLSALHAAALAGVAAGLSSLKSAVAGLIPGTVSPASLVRAGMKRAATRIVAPISPGTLAKLGQVPRQDGKRLGRRPKPPDPRDLQASRYLRLRRVRAPGKIDWAKPVRQFGVLLNDSLGDCGPAGWLHQLQVWLDNIGRLFTPGDSDALALYEAVGGYQPGDPSTDNGIVLRDLLKYVTRNAVDGGQRIAGYVAVDPKDHAAVKAAIYLCGGLYIGVALPVTAQSQGVHWTKKSGPNAAPGSWGGHCVVYTGYDSHGPKTVTWGEKGSASWGFHDAYCEEAWAVISPDWIAASGVDPTGLNLAQLTTDVQALTA